MRTLQKGWMVLAVAVMVVALSPAAHAQLNSTVSNVALNAVLGESLTVATSTGTLAVPIVPNGTGAPSPTVSITTTWALAKAPVARTSVKLFAYFGTAVALTDGAGDNIPNTAVLGSANAGPYGAFTNTVGTGPLSTFGIQIFNQAIGGAGTFNTARTDTLSLEINSTGLALPAATYTGTLSIQAQAL